MTILLTIFCISIWFDIFNQLNQSEKITIEKTGCARAKVEVTNGATPELPHTVEPTVVSTSIKTPSEGGNNLSLEEMIKREFGEDWKIALAVFKGESGLRKDAMNWNCKYTKNGKEYSTSCKVEDRHRAWSVDCGIAQINTLGQQCPSNLFDTEHNIKIAKAMYDRRGFQPWYVYTTGKYKKHL